MSERNQPDTVIYIHGIPIRYEDRKLVDDAFADKQQEISRLRAELERVKWERDAALKDRHPSHEYCVTPCDQLRAESADLAAARKRIEELEAMNANQARAIKASPSAVLERFQSFLAQSDNDLLDDYKNGQARISELEAQVEQMREVIAACTISMFKSPEPFDPGDIELRESAIRAVSELEHGGKSTWLSTKLAEERAKVWAEMQGFRDNIYLAHTCSDGDCAVCSIIHKFDKAKSERDGA